jgi:uncharacterized protein YecT (DUF1311 family)
MLALVLALTIDLDVDQVCAKYRADYRLPAAAAAALKECGEGCERELAEQFANGEEGVERDYDAAEYFLCQADDHMAPAEFEGMWQHLQKMRSGEETKDLEFCDWVTSGYGMSICASIRFDEEMPKLDQRLEALRGKVRAAPSFDVLLSKGKAYADAESHRIGEESRGGTGYAAFSLEAELDQKQKLVDALEKFAGERAPESTAKDLKTADGALNDAYQKARMEIEEFASVMGWSEEFRQILREAQRAWIAYRDAFASWYAEAWRGNAPPEALRREIVTQLTRARAAELRGD